MDDAPMSSGQLELSVVIPAFNAEATIGDQLEALANQDASFCFEVIVADNGSTDGTVDVVKMWQKRIPNLLLVDASERRGPSHARNAGAKRGNAPFLAFCDADDVVSTQWVREIHKALQAVEMVGGMTDYARLNPGREWDFGDNVPLYRDRAMPFFWATGAGNMGIRASVFREVGGFDERFSAGEDKDLCFRVQALGYSITGSESAVVHIRHRAGIVQMMRQTYAYGRADRQLVRHYSRLAAAYGASAKTSRQTKRVPAHVTVGQRIYNAYRRLRIVIWWIATSIRSRQFFVTQVRGFAYRLGYENGRIDMAIAPIEPPSLPLVRQEKGNSAIAPPRE
jgi:glycosyltransferase involved in cell wall biosynthesis